VNVLNTMQNFGLPTNCGPQTISLNGRTVTYTLSVPAAAPWNGTRGSCTEAPLSIQEAQGTTFGGLSALLYKYNLTFSASNLLGFTEARINNQFDVHLIPMFQFAAFYSGDMELLPGPTAIVNGRLHANGDMYLNSDSCGASPGSGLNILGVITVVGSGEPGTAPLNRGRKDDETVNHDNVDISLDGTSTNMQVLGTDAPGDTACAQAPTRMIGGAEVTSFDTLAPRVTTGIKSITLPGTSGLIGVPWTSGCPTGGGSYWQNANLILALDTTQTAALDGSGRPGSTSAPRLYPIEVLNSDGSVNGGLTQQLVAFMQQVPGAITYTDTPAGGSAGCRADPNCEADAYSNGGAYATPFPGQPGQAYTCVDGSGSPITRNPRDQIRPDGSNYCNDYRYGGFYNWRERKPMLIMNIDWMALEEWNRDNGGPLFDPGASANGGLIVFFTVKDTATTEGIAADNYAVRVYDAGRARWGSADPGATLASDRAMYLAGNFNCPQPTYTGPDTSPAPCGDASWRPNPGDPTFQKPASVVADTIDILSCNWVLQQAGGSIGPCGASPTIVNAAFFAGTDQTWCSSNHNGMNCGETYYSGGVENYPRYHENWSGVKFWYQGSLVSSGAPAHTCFAYTAQIQPVGDDPNYTCGAYPLQGFWTTQRYSPPTRRWFYDVSFDNAALLPPLTPRFTYINLVYFTQVFQ
jgi:hypothetical protein